MSKDSRRTEPEIEITSEMIEAGVRVLRAYSPDDSPELAVVRIYRAMVIDEPLPVGTFEFGK